FQVLLGSIVADPSRRLSELEVLTGEERERVLVEWNDTAADVPQRTVSELFEDQVALSPDAVAVVFGEEWLSYAELNGRANRLAHRLVECGVGPEVLVAICVERSLEMVVGLLGILKAGGAYVPMDPADPKERLAFMLGDTAAPVLVTQQHLVRRLPPGAVEVICLDADRAIPA